MEGKLKLVYDVNTAPQKLGVANMIKIMEQHGVVFYDSDKGLKPQFYSGDSDTPNKTLIVDTKDNEIDFKQYQREFDESLFWNKELYNCRNSPIYYWNNYGTLVYPATSKETSKFLVGIGMKDLSNADATKAAKMWEKQKERVAKSMEFVTIEHLKDRKGAIDILKAESAQKIASLEYLLKDQVDLYNAKGELHEEKKRINNLVGRIRQVPQIPVKWEQYKNKKRKWDGAMLFNTNYNTLLEIYDEIQPDTNKSKHKVLDISAK